MKFKVGDKVRVLSNYPSGSCWKKGYEGKITEIDTDNEDCRLDGAVGGFVQFDNIELITNSKTKEKPYMRKKYILLKETDILKKGAVLEEMCDDGTQDFKCITPEFEKFPIAGHDEAINRKVVISQPTWYQEVTVMYVLKDKLEKVKKLMKKII